MTKIVWPPGDEAARLKWAEEELQRLYADRARLWEVLDRRCACGKEPYVMVAYCREHAPEMYPEAK